MTMTIWPRVFLPLSFPVFLQLIDAILPLPSHDAYVSPGIHNSSEKEKQFEFISHYKRLISYIFPISVTVCSSFWVYFLHYLSISKAYSLKLYPQFFLFCSFLKSNIFHDLSFFFFPPSLSFFLCFLSFLPPSLTFSLSLSSTNDKDLWSV